VLETPELPAQVRALPPDVLGKLIDRIGLEDAGELVALATTEQLARIFDEDLWRSERAGEDERFDAERFAVWLEIMLEAGEQAVAERLTELPPELVTLAFHRHLLVLGLDDLRAELGAGDDEAEAAEKALSSCLSEEIDEYQLIWRGGDGFDAVLAALLALDRDHHDFVVALLERCAALSSEYIADNGGLYEVLSSEEMLEQDLAGERENRRAERGYVAPSAAVAFLRLCRGTAATATPSTEHDPLTRAYFRELSRAPRAARERAAPASPRRDLSALLEHAGVASEPQASPRLAGATEEREPLLMPAMRELRDVDPEKFTARSEELAYLGNVLVSATSGGEERLRPLEAVELAAFGVSFGLALVCGAAAPGVSEARRALTDHPCDALFRLALQRAARAEATPGQDERIDGEGLRRARALLKRLKI
jgi:hypothetical protein